MKGGGGEGRERDGGVYAEKSILFLFIHIYLYQKGSTADTGMWQHAHQPWLSSFFPQDVLLYGRLNKIKTSSSFVFTFF